MNRASHPSRSSSVRCIAAALTAPGRPRKASVPSRVQVIRTDSGLPHRRRQPLNGSRSGRSNDRNERHDRAFNQIHGSGPDPLCDSSCRAETSCKAPVHVERLALFQYVIAGPRQFVRQRLDRNDAVGPGLLAVVEALGLGKTKRVSLDLFSPPSKTRRF